MKGTARKALPLAVVLTVIAATSASAAGAWKHQASPNPGGYVNFLQAVSTESSTDAWAAGVSLNAPGLHCETLIEHYNGTKWSHVSSPNPGSANDYLYGIKMTSSSNVWAVGTDGTSGASKTLVLHYDGSSWTQQSSPSPSASLNTLVGVAATSDTNAWAVGLQGLGGLSDCSQYAEPGVLPASRLVPAAGSVSTLIEHYDGTSWTTQSGSSPGACWNALNGVSATSTTDAWAAGDSSSECSVNRGLKTLVEHYDGSRWVKLSTKNPGKNGNVLDGISADDSTDVWAVGSELEPTGPYAANGLILHYDGTTWKSSKVVKGDASALYAVKATSPTNVWAVGAYSSGGADLPLILHYDGTKWTVQTAKPAGSAGALYGVGATGPANAFAVGECANCGGRPYGTLAYHYG